MKIRFNLLAIFIALPFGVWADPLAASDLSEIAGPPDEALLGEEHKGVQIGLWSEKSIYKGSELRNVWRIAKNNRSEGLRIGVGGNIYTNSFLYVTEHGKNVARIPMGSGIDGIVNPTSSRGGISHHIAKFPKGVYELTWKTESHTSNTITIEVK